MPIKVTCPKCQGVLHAPDDAGGKRGKCPTCGTVLAIPAAGLAAPPAAVPVGTAASAVVPIAPPKPAAEPHGYGLAPPAGGEVRQSAVPMLPRSGEPKPAAGFGSPPAAKSAAGGFSRPAPVSADVAAAEVRGYGRAKRGLGLVQFGQFLLLLAGLAGPGVAIGKLYGLHLPDKDPGYLGKAGLSSVTEIEYGSVVVPLALGLLFVVLGRVGFGNVPRSSFARGPAKWGGLFALLAVMGLIAAAAVAGNAFVTTGLKAVEWRADGTPSLHLLPTDDLTGKIQVGGLLALLAFGLLAETFFVSGIGRLAAGLHHDTAASRHTRFLFWTHLGAGLLVGWFVLRALMLGQAAEDWSHVWGWVTTHWDDALGKSGAARPAVVYGLMTVPPLVVWFLYTRLVGGGRRAIGDWLAAHG